MTNKELCQTLRTASASVNENIALAMLLVIAAERIENLDEKNTQSSWHTNPDRSGGQFTDEEIDRAGEWR